MADGATAVSEPSSSSSEPVRQSVLGIIHPPRELRNVVDKTAEFVAKSARTDFENRLREREANNPKFHFLDSQNPYHGYYQHKVAEFRAIAAAAAAAAESASAEPTQEGRKKNVLKQKAVVIADPPPELRFIADPPTLNAEDVDIMRLTAQFVAKNGRQFLTALSRQEENNRQFDFLKQYHTHYPYFALLIDQYMQILFTSEPAVAAIKKDAKDSQGILERVHYRSAWNRQQVQNESTQEGRRSRETYVRLYFRRAFGMAYNSIDWHDFVIVETVEYSSFENDPDLPPPIKPEQLGMRAVAQQRIQEFMHQEETATDGDEGGDSVPSGPAPAAPVVVAPTLVPGVQGAARVVRGYDPKAQQRAGAAAGFDKVTYQVCPRCKEQVPLADFAEHLRVELLDPRWMEQRDKMLHEKKEIEAMFASGEQIGSTLKQFAQRRGDIFASDAEKAAALAAANAAAFEPSGAGVPAFAESAFEVAASENRQAPLLPGPPMHGAPPPPTALLPPPMLPSQSQPLLPPPQMPPPPVALGAEAQAQYAAALSARAAIHSDRLQMLGGGPPVARAPLLGAVAPPPPPQQQHEQFVPRPNAAPLLPLSGGMYGVNLAPQLPNLAPPLDMRLPDRDANEEPDSKRVRMDDSIGPAEQHFAATHPGPILLQVQVPNLVGDKNGWQCSGQVLQLTLDSVLTSFVTLKSMIQEHTLMPAAKQKLQIAGTSTFLKDTTPAFYQLESGTALVLSVKERGGRK
ncbi:hypothetical protein CAOG_009678 [Capsaspora owczarzaki ATCC 30864]|uniref:SURP motif domain-containing protein n=1 Tax=Capsaspora owczarzaki (strain ATCC 30864) TaxID=595528 RepID=A0A0D2UBZ6_CAPO3|nr:hypothetical protein CAOG_009678 [Capsaspora owczarzaki ATCC 30864]